MNRISVLSTSDRLGMVGNIMPMWWAIVQACLLIPITSVNCEDVLVGEDPVFRPMADFRERGNFSTTILNPMVTTPVEGLLTGFEVFMLNPSGCITIQVWRRTIPRYTLPVRPVTTTPSVYSSTAQPGNPAFWTFIGGTSKCAQTEGNNQTVKYKLPSDDYIRVQPGDVIGYNAVGSNSVAYSVNTDCSIGQRSLAPTNVEGYITYLRKTNSYRFSELNQCRNYSLQVTIARKECARVNASRVAMNISFTSQGLATVDECWIVEALNKTVSVIRLLFRELTLPDYYGCSRRFVQINDGDSAPSHSGYVKRVCSKPSRGDSVVDQITSGAAYIRFWHKAVTETSADTSRQIKFVMEYAAMIESPCQNMTVTEMPMFLRSPGYPSVEYEPNTKLCWRLRVAENSTDRVRVRMDGDYGLQKPICTYFRRGCTPVVCKDYIEVTDGESPHNSPMLTKWCNASRQHNLIETSSGQVLTIYFVTDSSVQAKGFQLKAFTVNPDALQCSHYIAVFGPQVMESPYYPFGYPSNRDDCWVVKASSTAMRILVTVLDSRLEDDIDCSKDWVEVLDGKTGSAPLLRRWCGSTLPAPLLSSGSCLYIRFVSNSYRQFPGFRLSYEQITTDSCTMYHAYSHKQYLNGEVQATNGTGVRCWLIQAVKGHLRIQWESVDQAIKLGDCENTYVELYDGDSHRAPLIGKYCESKPIDKHGVHIDGSIIYVRWIVNSAPAKFRLAYMTLSSGHCQMKFVKDVPVQLTSSRADSSSRSYYYPTPRPNNPAPVGPCINCKYGKNQQDCWVIESDQKDGRLLLRLSFFELQDKDSRGQCKDSLEIYDGRSLGDPLMGVLCGSVPARNFTSTGNALLVTFQSDSTIEKRGFRLTVTNAVTSTGCSKLDANNFNSTLVNPPVMPAYGEKCWTICSPTDNHPVRVYAQSIHLRQGEIISFYDGPSNEALLIRRFDYKTKLGAMVVSSASTLTMVMRRGTQTGGQIGSFILHYSWLFSARCAYKSITKEATTSLMTKGYGSQQYPNKDYACWVLTTQNVQQAIELHAKKFDVEDGDKCTADYLEIYDGPNKADDTLLHRWCGKQDGVMLAQSSGRSLYVIFSSDAQHQFPGFELEVVAVDNFNVPNRPGAGHNKKQSASILSEANIVIIVVIICAVIVIIVVVVAFTRKRASAENHADDRVVYRSHPAADGDDIGALQWRDSQSETHPISAPRSTADTARLL